ncbi:MAG: hypothetical protein A2Z24_03020 [Candidatus Woykebacteria bacterium RBG_16_44_10]|uniref:Glycerate kinase n=1 Tax=Candidatus Woykebacteria bacterium RBG_16_44_10 TaxID=1802597 RepID=A0A1G1WEY4_9BACT|nr:MAG: hypothetical protein A2Z24_03020 [Candidatus Woykebacteria bacterium RBG_16_44_10]
MVIKNFAQLATSPLRRDALEIIDAGFSAINTEKVIKNTVSLESSNLLRVKDQWFDLSRYRRVYLVGIGKVAYAAAKALEDILGDLITDGVVLDIQTGPLRKVRSLVGTHPNPTQANVSATREITSLLRAAGEEDLVLAIVSGGGSALLCSPYQISCEEKSAVIAAMMNSWATIEELNTVRKHLSEIKGGNFAKLAHPAQIVALIFSDVPGDDVGLVASGPTVLDTTTIADAAKLMARYDVLKKCRLPHCDLVETPKDPVYFQLVTNIVLANNRLAVEAMEVAAVKLEYRAEVFSAQIEGPAVDVAKRLVLNAKPKTALIAAGETTVDVRGDGIGGRNQHLVLAALKYLTDDQVLVSVNSDGIDRSTYAGAIGDKTTLAKAKKKKLSTEKFLKNCDSFNFFKKVGDGIETGILGSNAADLTLVLAR